MSASMPRASRARSMRPKPAWPPSIMPRQLSDQTMQLMKQKHIPAVPTFVIFEYFADHAATPEAGAREHAMLDYKIREFKSRWRRAFPLPSAPMSGPSRMAPRRANSS